MEKKHYDNNKLDSIRKYIRNFEMHDAILQLQSYLKKYPNDFGANTMYADALIGTGNFEEAEYIIDSIPINSHTFSDYQDRINIIKLYLLSYQEKYEEAYEFLTHHSNKINFTKHSSESFISLYLRKKLDILSEDDYSNKLYISRQIINYNDEEAINHIKRHVIGTSQYKKLLRQKNKLMCDADEEQYEQYEQYDFKEDFPLDDIFKKLKERLPSTPKLYKRGMENVYFCKYDGSGIRNLKESNYIYVCTLNNTNEIITMYPCKGVSKMSYIDLNPAREVDEVKIKRLSQIDKFNQRYGLK